MDDVGTLAKAATTLPEFATSYFQRLAEVLSSIDPQALVAFERTLLHAREHGQTVFVAGNGGSASTATTMANDLGSDVMRKTGSAPLRILSLSDNNSVLTALANDVGYERVFLDQLRIHYRPGDVLIVISASGNSPNVVRAAEWVKEQQGEVVGLLGFDGGRLLELCDIAVHVRTEHGEYGPVEDAHLVVNHLLAHWLQATLKRQGTGSLTLGRRHRQAQCEYRVDNCNCDQRSQAS